MPLIRLLAVETAWSQPLLTIQLRSQKKVPKLLTFILLFPKSETITLSFETAIPVGWLKSVSLYFCPGFWSRIPKIRIKLPSRGSIICKSIRQTNTEMSMYRWVLYVILCVCVLCTFSCFKDGLFNTKWAECWIMHFVTFM